MYDIVIIGGGPAGMTAAIYARRNGRSVLLLEKEGFGGQIAFSPRVDNYPGVPYVSGAELAEQMLSQVLALDTDTDIGTVCAIRDENGVKTVLTEEGDSFTGRCVIIAAGARHRQLGLPGETELVGRGVSYCAVCDGAFYPGAAVAVAGGGDSALQEALLLSEICGRVYLIHRRDSFRGEEATVARLKTKENVRFVYNSTVTALNAEKRLKSIEVTNKDGSVATLEVNGLFVAVGRIPENRNFAAVAELDESGYAIAGENCRTKTPGVFVAGDNRQKDVRQLVTAAADGAVAATEAVKYVNEM